MTRHFRGRMINVRGSIYMYIRVVWARERFPINGFPALSERVETHELYMRKFCFIYSIYIYILTHKNLNKRKYILWGKIIIAVGGILRPIRLYIYIYIYLISWISTRHHLYRSCSWRNICINYARDWGHFATWITNHDVR